MPFADMLVREFDQEMSKTRTTLERVPKDEWDWKPHEKSGTLGWMAGHVATLPGFSIPVSTAPDLDLADAKSPKVEKDTDLIGLFDKVSADARAAIANLSDAQLNEPWSLKRNGKVLFTMPLRHAARHVFQPCHSPPRPINDVSSNSRSPSTGALWTVRGRESFSVAARSRKGALSTQPGARIRAEFETNYRQTAL